MLRRSFARPRPQQPIWPGSCIASYLKETIMNKDQVEGQIDQMKGKFKQGVGKATNDPELHDEGVADEAAGTMQEGVGKAKEKVGNAVKDLGDKIKH
jgi:uncharacterized protein YjbJ (UPF0337 family)